MTFNAYVDKQGLTNDSIMYRAPGNINGVNGTFEIGVRPSGFWTNRSYHASLFPAGSTKMITLDETFEHDFDCKQLHELPNDVLPRYFSLGGNRRGGHDGLIIRVCPGRSAPWLGIFEFGNVLLKGRNALHTWPDPKVLCVVARAQGYIVRVDEPTSYEIINVHPITDVIPVASRRLVVFASYTELVAYGEVGVVWVSDRLAWDGFTVSSVTDEHIYGSAWDPSVEKEVRFRVDLRNGYREVD